MQLDDRMHRMNGRFLTGLATLVTMVFLTMVSLTACGPGSSASGTPSRGSGSAAAAATPLNGPAASASGTTAPGSGTTTSGSGSSPAGPGKEVPMQTASGGEFVSPTGNISCEVSKTKATCQTGTPAQSAALGADGQYTTCKGESCLGNPGDGTPTLQYGTSTGVGPFRCTSARTGVTCEASGQGFTISTGGVTDA